MYTNYFGFSEKPFTLSPNPRFIFFSSIHREAFALLLYGIDNRFGFMELVGEVGTGKTTVLRTLLGRLDEEKYRTALVFNPPPSGIDLLRSINREFNLPATSENVSGLLDELNQFLLQENLSGRTAVLVIDEAQNLTPEVLEQVRLISNLETETDKLIQIVLAGQPELSNLLEKRELRQLNQRIALRYRLGPLSRDNLKAYIAHRLEVAGGRGKIQFTAGAYRKLFRYSGGIPRLLNTLCDRALLIAYTENSWKVSGMTVSLAWQDVTLKSPRTGRLRLALLLLILALSALALGMTLIRG